MSNPIDPEILATKIQYPLVLSWALTIHKSQGLTLNKVIIDFSDIFLDGQAYVALSRCKSLKNIKLLNFDYKKITINNEIVKFYNNLYFIDN
jgi:ATP-dependent DNA helicase PIF1